MNIYILVSTIDEGIVRVPAMLQAECDGVFYVVCWQQTRKAQPEEAAARLAARKDVTLTLMEGRGLSRSRNHAVATALAMLDTPLDDAVFVFADDDEQFGADAFSRIRREYTGRPRMDGALFRLRSSTDGRYFKPYPANPVAFGKHPRYYYPCSWEMTFRARVWLTGVRFNERFGLGAEVLCSGEEDVLLTDMLRKGLLIMILPEDIGRTEPVTTGCRVLDNRVLRSKGAVYGHRYSLPRALIRSLREAVSLSVRKKVSPLRLFREIWSGVKYIRK